MNETSTSFRLSPEARKLLKTMAKKWGVSQADLVEMGVRVLEKMLDKEIDLGKLFGREEKTQ